MQYQTEKIENLSQSQQLISELFSFIGEHFDQSAQLRPEWTHFFQVWAGQTPYTKIKVFTAREDGKIKGCVMALLLENPLFVTKPTIHRFVDLTQGDKAFDDYVKIVLESF